MITLEVLTADGMTADSLSISEAPMAFSNSAIVPGPTLFKYLRENTLEQIDSDPESSVYRFACGCRAARWAHSVNCFVQWCPQHVPRLHAVK